MGEAWESSKKQCYFENRGSFDDKVLSFHLDFTALQKSNTIFSLSCSYCFCHLGFRFYRNLPKLIAVKDVSAFRSIEILNNEVISNRQLCFNFKVPVLRRTERLLPVITWSLSRWVCSIRMGRRSVRYQVGWNWLRTVLNTRLAYE
jgi:hypothetical protein